MSTARRRFQWPGKIRFDRLATTSTRPRWATADGGARWSEWRCGSYLKSGACSGPPFAPSL